MRRSTTVLSLLAAFAAGCVTTQWIPAVNATTRPQFEYVCIDAWAGVTHSSNQLGKQGWEMVAGTGDAMMWCFKRRAQ